MKTFIIVYCKFTDTMIDKVDVSGKKLRAINLKQNEIESRGTYYTEVVHE